MNWLERQHVELIVAALEVKAEQYIHSLHDLQDEQGHALVVRNGRSHYERSTQSTAGSIKIRAPRVNDRRPDHHFSSKILPPYMRRSPCLGEALPVLYLRGLATGDFAEALPVLLGTEAAGFSATTITRLLGVWREEYTLWWRRPMEGRDSIYVWADGIHFQVRLEEDRLASLVILGVLPDGRKQITAVEDGYRESPESWASGLWG